MALSLGALSLGAHVRLNPEAMDAQCAHVGTVFRMVQAARRCFVFGAFIWNEGVEGRSLMELINRDFSRYETVVWGPIAMCEAATAGPALCRETEMLDQVVRWYKSVFGEGPFPSVAASAAHFAQIDLRTAFEGFKRIDKPIRDEILELSYGMYVQGNQSDECVIDRETFTQRVVTDGAFFALMLKRGCALFFCRRAIQMRTMRIIQTTKGPSFRLDR